MRYLFFLILLVIPFVETIAQTTDSNDSWFKVVEEIAKDPAKSQPLFGTITTAPTETTTETQPDSSSQNVTPTSSNDSSQVNTEIGSSDSTQANIQTAGDSTNVAETQNTDALSDSLSTNTSEQNPTSTETPTETSNTAVSSDGTTGVQNTSAGTSAGSNGDGATSTEPVSIVNDSTTNSIATGISETSGNSSGSSSETNSNTSSSNDLTSTTNVESNISAYDFAAFENSLLDSTYNADADTLEDMFRPEIGVGAGLITFFGDVNDSYRKNIDVGRIGRSLLITRKVNDFLNVNFFAMQGVLTGNERTEDRNLNFKTDILLGGTSFTYNFYHLLKAQKTIMPYVSLGIETFEFNSKGDMYDSQGRLYHYWSDGSIRNKAENSPTAASSIMLQRDYVYETDLRDLDADQFGQYQQVALALPIDIGIDLKLTHWITMRLGNTFHISFNDLIDNVSSKGTGNRQGKSGGDKFMYSYFSFRFNLFSIMNQSDDDKKYNMIDFSKVNGDEDNDGVLDFSDLCPGTPVGNTVDLNGCPADSDGDGIRDPFDSEINTSSEVFVIDANGVGKTEDDYLNSGVADSLAVTVQESLKKSFGAKKGAKSFESFYVEIPQQFKIFDTDKDGYISPEELSQAFDMFFDFDTNLTINDMYMFQDFFFDQTLDTDK